MHPTPSPTARTTTPLTDQALVAVAVGHAHARAAVRTPTVADLLLGLAQEADGAAGQFLRTSEGPLTALAMRSLPPRLAPLDVARTWAVADRTPLPVWTVDLLAAVVEAGGTELRDLLATVGLEPAALTPADDLRRALGRGGYRELGRRTVARETVGLRPPGAATGPLTPAADRAVASVRAVGGGAVDLLLAMADDPAVDVALPALGELAAAWARVAPAAGGLGAPWDAGLDAVVHAATTWCAGRRVEPADLVAAAVVAGGEGPGRLLEAAAGP